MINSVSSGANFQPMQRPQAEPLTSEQTELMNETLAQFDPENLTAEDAQSIMQTFMDAGIQPGQEMEAIMAEAGFDAAEVGELGRFLKVSVRLVRHHHRQVVIHLSRLIAKKLSVI